LTYLSPMLQRMKETNNQNLKTNAVSGQVSTKTATIILFISASVLLICIICLFLLYNTVPFDQEIFAAISPYITESRTRFMVAVSFLGNHIFLVPVNLLLLFYFIIRKNNRLALRIAVISLSSLSLMSFFKNIFQRHRPEQPLVDGVTNFSFPSGHAFMSVAFYGLLIWLIAISIINKRIQQLVIAFLLLLILLIGFSRIYLRMHYTSDVLAGFCMGYIWMIFCLWLTDKAQQEK
jgi:membrane-associated phospholipid phosphatase